MMGRTLRWIFAGLLASLAVAQAVEVSSIDELMELAAKSGQDTE